MVYDLEFLKQFELVWNLKSKQNIKWCTVSLKSILPEQMPTVSFFFSLVRFESSVQWVLQVKEGVQGSCLRFFEGEIT